MSKANSEILPNRTRIHTGKLLSKLVVTAELGPLLECGFDCRD
jgi:hypothetical protein